MAAEVRDEAAAVDALPDAVACAMLGGSECEVGGGFGGLTGARVQGSGTDG